MNRIGLVAVALVGGSVMPGVAKAAVAIAPPALARTAIIPVEARSCQDIIAKVRRYDLSRTARADLAEAQEQLARGNNGACVAAAERAERLAVQDDRSYRRGDSRDRARSADEGRRSCRDVIARVEEQSRRLSRGARDELSQAREELQRGRESVCLAHAERAEREAQASLGDRDYDRRYDDRHDRGSSGSSSNPLGTLLDQLGGGRR